MKTAITITVIAFLSAACSSAPKIGERVVEYHCGAVTTSTEEFVCSSRPDKGVRELKLSCDGVRSNTDEWVCTQPR